MLTDITRRLFTVEEYDQMAEAGILRPDDHVELIDGEIVQMSPVGYRHWICVNRVNALFTEAWGRRSLVAIQGPVRLTDWTEPQPDIVVFKPRRDFYAGKRAAPEDVLLIVEVADSSLAYDRRVKLPRYASVGVPEYWIEDLNNELLLVFREPAVDKYSFSLTLGRGESISPLAFPESVFNIDDLLGEPPTVE